MLVWRIREKITALLSVVLYITAVHDRVLLTSMSVVCFSCAGTIVCWFRFNLEFCVFFVYFLLVVLSVAVQLIAWKDWSLK